jgi:hypothetical protein
MALLKVNATATHLPRAVRAVGASATHNETMLKFLFLLVVGVFALIGVAVVGLLAFGDDDDPEPDTGALSTPAGSGATVEGTLTAEALLQQSADRAAAVQSFHFILTHENGTTPLPLNLDLESAEGDVVVPGRLKAEVDAEALGGLNVSVEVIGIDDQTWVTNPFTRGWEELPNTNIRDFADPAALVSGLLPAVQDAELREGEELDGVETQLVTGQIDSGALQDALGIAVPGNNVDVEAWIGVDDQLPRRVRLIGALSDEESADVVRQVDLSRFDQPVEIMPPE